MGLLINGALYRGAGGAAGEIGYMPLGCGDPHDRGFRRRGQLEESMGASAVLPHAPPLALPPTPAKSVFTAARRGDGAARAAVDAEAARVALAIAAVSAVI